MGIEVYCDVDHILDAFQALADPTRLAVFLCVRNCGETLYDPATGECTPVCDVRCQIPCAPSTLSHHLNVLRAAGLIVTEKRGRQVYAKVVPKTLAALRDFFGGQLGENSAIPRNDDGVRTRAEV